MSDSLSGPDFYDDEDVFSTYMDRSGREDDPITTLEKPVLLELLGSVQGLDVLDLGCGSATIGVELLQAGARSYTGVEGSQNMVAAAQANLAHSAGRVIHARLENWSYPAETYDLVISLLTLHYLADLPSVLAQIYRTLRPGGRLIISVEHPVLTSSDSARPPGAQREYWIVDDYFRTGRRETQWLGGRVVKYHHTIQDYFLAVQAAGFAIESLRESHPQRQHFHSEATYKRRLRIPLFLFIRAKKP